MSLSYIVHDTVEGYPPITHRIEFDKGRVYGADNLHASVVEYIRAGHYSAMIDVVYREEMHRYQWERER